MFLWSLLLNFAGRDVTQRGSLSTLMSVKKKVQAMLPVSSLTEINKGYVVNFDESKTNALNFLRLSSSSWSSLPC